MLQPGEDHARGRDKGRREGRKGDPRSDNAFQRSAEWETCMGVPAPALRAGTLCSNSSTVCSALAAAEGQRRCLAETPLGARYAQTT